MHSKTVSLRYAWIACIKSPERLAPYLISQLAKIDFDQVERDFQELKITPDGWDEFLRWLYYHDRQNRWFPQIEEVRFVGKRAEGEERRTRQCINVVDIHECRRCHAMFMLTSLLS
jgi:hypothetical protein